MSLETIIASSSNDFSLIVTMTDSYIPACNTWIGDYPYLQKRKFIKSISKAFAKRYNNDDVINNDTPDNINNYSEDNNENNDNKDRISNENNSNNNNNNKDINMFKNNIQSLKLNAIKR